MLIERLLAPRLAATRRSVLLLGPRQTGKSTLMRSFAPVLAVNLARESEYLQFARNPRALEERLAPLTGGSVLLDEVQRMPSLLNTVQAVLDEGGGRFRFLITGSSARKLRRGHANLLPGRIVQYMLAPLLVGELAGPLNVAALLAIGSLPGIWTDPDRREAEEVLSTYASTYVREEIQAEALTRNLEGFSRFLFVAAACATQQLDLAKLASQASIARTSAQRYFEILEDTLLFFRVDAYATDARRRLLQHPRYYVFDNGVLNGLLGSFTLASDRIGRLFENFFVSQLHHLVQTTRAPWRLASYRTEHGAEVDIVVELPDRHLAIELKASRNVGASDLRGIRSFRAVARKPSQAWVVYLGESRREIAGVPVIPWEMALRELHAAATASR